VQDKADTFNCHDTIYDMLGGPEKTGALKAAKRASARSAAVVHRELKRGLNSLATIASTAPWVGFFGTILGIHNSFGAVNGSKESIMANIFDGLSQAFVPCAFGLIVALVAMWCYKYLLAEVEAFDSEMEGASLQLINDLRRLE
jgi:biopolymer transport protein ExbB/TolQ